MEIFWNTIAAYNAATWPAQIVFTGIATLLLLLLCLRPTNTVRIAMKSFMAMLNFWIAGVYYDLLVKHASLERTGQHNAFAVLLLAMPLIYPLCSLALGHEFPMMTSPVMPCSVAVFTIGLMLAFSEQVNIVLAMFLYIFFREYVRSNADRPTKPSAHVLDALLIALSLVVGIFFTVTLLHQLDLFTQII